MRFKILGAIALAAGLLTFGAVPALASTHGVQPGNSCTQGWDSQNWNQGHDCGNRCEDGSTWGFQDRDCCPVFWFQPSFNPFCNPCPEQDTWMNTRDRGHCPPPPCAPQDVNFTFPHGSTVLTENWGPVLRNNEIASYNGKLYVLENVHGKWFSVEAEGTSTLVTNHGPTIWFGNALLLCTV